MDLEQLAAELDMLKQESMANKQQQRFGGFIDKYGTKFNNNADIANLILAEMDRRGVDEASEAASEAVQAVLDKLREEATAVLDSIKGQEAQVSDLMDKVNSIQESVDAASSGAGGMGETPSPDMATDMGAAPGGDMGAGAPPPDMGAGGGMGAAPGGDMGGGDMGAAPGGDMGGGDMGAGAPPDMGAGGDMGAGAPPDMGGGAPPPEEPPPPGMATGGYIPSDVRLKNIRSQFQRFAQSRKQTVPSDQRIKAWKPRSETLSVLKGLM